MPADPRARAAIEERRAAVERQNAGAQAVRDAEQQAHIARLRALGTDLSALKVFQEALAEVESVETSRIVATSDAADLYRAQGALRAIASVRKVLDRARTSQQPPQA